MKAIQPPRLRSVEQNGIQIVVTASAGLEVAEDGPQPGAHGPLTGIRVLELGSFIAGPFAGQLLGDYGAEVIKIEPPGPGDPMRRWGVTRDGESLWWPALARNKRSVVLDLRTEEDRGVLRDLAAEVDVIVENFRPGRLAEWGLDYGSLRARNPALVLVHVSGFGQSGPRAADAGFGSVGEAMGGIRHTTGEPDRPPARCGISLGDSLAALFAVIGTTAALVERAASGQGQEVDVAIYEAVAALMESSLADYAVAGVQRSRTGSVLPGVAPSNAYPTADASEILIAGNADSVFARLCKVMGAAQLVDDERFATHDARGAHMAELDDLIGAWTATLPADQLLAALSDAGVPAGRVYTAADVLADEHYAARDMVVRLANAAGTIVPMAGVVPKFSRTPGAVRHVGPRPGADSEAVRAALAARAPTPS
jgi:formyl-CoA transferase/succinyl-CoA--D-citramalate CoA-transferase